MYLVGNCCGFGIVRVGLGMLNVVVGGLFI